MTLHPIRAAGEPRRSGRHRLRWAAGGAVVLLAASVIAANAADASVPPTPSGWTQVFADDFNGAANTGLNTSNWLYDIGTSYPDGAGNLVIKPIRAANGSWTSGRVETQRTDFAAPAGGKLRLEGRLQQPNVSGAAAAGYWPAFWALGAAARGTGASGWPGIGEIDMMEDINGLSSEFATLHCGT